MQNCLNDIGGLRAIRTPYSRFVVLGAQLITRLCPALPILLSAHKPLGFYTLIAPDCFVGGSLGVGVSDGIQVTKRGLAK